MTNGIGPPQAAGGTGWPPQAVSNRHGRPPLAANRLRRRPVCLIAGGVMLCGLIAGCGSESYKHRVLESSRYFEHLLKVDSVLAKQSWEHQPFGIELRVPSQFELIPAPEILPAEQPAESRATESDTKTDQGNDAAEKRGEGAGNDSDGRQEDSTDRDASSERKESTDRNDEPEERKPETADGRAPKDDADSKPDLMEDAPFDPRQPDYIDARLPGMVAAWRATLAVDIGDQLEGRAAYIYLCTNHQRFLDREADNTVKPLDFTTDFTNALASGLHMPRDTAADPWSWKKETIPTGLDVYAPPKEMASVTRTPENGIDGLKVDFRLYRYENKDIQGFLLFVVPQKVDRRENIEDGIKYCLESLKISAKIPQNVKKPGAGGSGGPGF